MLIMISTLHRHYRHPHLSLCPYKKKGKVEEGPHSQPFQVIARETEVFSHTPHKP
jgi:hypothetical protein